MNSQLVLHQQEHLDGYSSSHMIMQPYILFVCAWSIIGISFQSPVSSWLWHILPEKPGWSYIVYSNRWPMWPSGYSMGPWWKLCKWSFTWHVYFSLRMETCQTGSARKEGLRWSGAEKCWEALVSNPVISSIKQCETCHILSCMFTYIMCGSYYPWQLERNHRTMPNLQKYHRMPTNLLTMEKQKKRI